jgi:hypothetical protein
MDGTFATPLVAPKLKLTSMLFVVGDKYILEGDSEIK